VPFSAVIISGTQRVSKILYEATSDHGVVLIDAIIIARDRNLFEFTIETAG